MPGKKNLLVTGGSGFIGKNIANYFHNIANVIAPSHSELELLSQNAVDRFFKDYDIDYVIHCANIGGNRKSGNNQEIIEKNLRMFFNISKNSKHFERLIHFGSGAEYDKSRPLCKINEVSIGESIPIDCYGFSKYVISRYIEKSENIVCLRLFGVFGKYEDYEYKFISNAILKNLLHLPIIIQQNVTFDWLYIDDLMRIIPYFFEPNNKYRAFNITPGRSCDLISIANYINKHSEFKSEIIIETAGMNNEYSGDNARLLSHIGNFQFTSIDEAIGDLIGYYRNILSHIDAEIIKRDEYASLCKTKTVGLSSTKK